VSKELYRIPSDKIVLNDGYDPKTPPKPKQIEIEQVKIKPAVKKSHEGEVL
jgi:hypothetical protein